MKNYPGSKAGSGVWQRIIALMPPHEQYIEPYLGGGTILRRKRPAQASLAGDIDEDVIRWHQQNDPQTSTTYVAVDALKLLTSINPTVRDLVYCDPPYLLETRRAGNAAGRIYSKQGHVSHAQQHHMHLVQVLRSLRCQVILSGYRSELYDSELRQWHRIDYNVMTHRGPRVESAWCNFEPGVAFHDTRYLGADYRERERIKRKRDRWASRFAAMSAEERAVIAEALQIAGGTAGNDERAPNRRRAPSELPRLERDLFEARA